MSCDGPYLLEGEEPAHVELAQESLTNLVDGALFQSCPAVRFTFVLLFKKMSKKR